MGLEGKKRQEDFSPSRQILSGLSKLSRSSSFVHRGAWVRLLGGGRDAGAAQEVLGGEAEGRGLCLSMSSVLSPSMSTFPQSMGPERWQATFLECHCHNMSK